MTSFLNYATGTLIKGPFLRDAAHVSKKLFMWLNRGPRMDNDIESHACKGPHIQGRIYGPVTSNLSEGNILTDKRKDTEYFTILVYEIQDHSLLGTF